MKRMWLIAWQEYRKHVLTRRFLFGVLSVPLLMMAIIGLLIFIMILTENEIRAIGYVDHSGLLAQPLPPPPVKKTFRTVEFRPYPDEEAARAALDADEIQAYYLIPSDYVTSGRLRVVYREALRDLARQQFYDFLTVNLLADQEPAVVQRVLKGSEVVIRSADGLREVSQGNFVAFILPLVFGVAILVVMFSAGGYLMNALVDEKENRTLEVILTSVSPRQFMAGKIFGDLGVGLTQISIWLVVLIVLILAWRDTFSWLRAIQIAPQTILVFVVVILPAFFMVAALMATIGATVAEGREGQQMVGFISLPMCLPYMLAVVIMAFPHSPLAVGLSLFPFTAPFTMLLRDSVTSIPRWQIGLVSVLQILSAWGALWLAGRALRLGMLRYGKRITWRELFSRQGAKA